MNSAREKLRDIFQSHGPYISTCWCMEGKASSGSFSIARAAVTFALSVAACISLIRSVCIFRQLTGRTLPMYQITIYSENNTHHNRYTSKVCSVNGISSLFDTSLYCRTPERRRPTPWVPWEECFVALGDMTPICTWRGSSATENPFLCISRASCWAWRIVADCDLPPLAPPTHWRCLDESDCPLVDVPLPGLLVGKLEAACFNLRTRERQTTQRRGRQRWVTATWMVLTKHLRHTTLWPHGNVCIVALAQRHTTHWKKIRNYALVEQMCWYTKHPTHYAQSFVVICFGRLYRYLNSARVVYCPTFTMSVQRQLNNSSGLE